MNAAVYMCARASRHVFLAGAPVILPLCVASACGKAEAPGTQVARMDSAGVEIVTNRGADRLLGWSLDSILAVHSPTGTRGDTVGFFIVTDIATTEDRIVVLDRSQPALLVYDTLGQFQGRFGRKGRGPGEFEYPVSVAVPPGGGVAVFDLLNGRIERFDISFAPAGSLPLLHVRVRPGAMRFAGEAVVVPTFRISADTAVFGLQTLGPTDTTVLATLYQLRNRRPVTMESCGFDLPPGYLPVVFAPTLRWTPDRRGGVLLTKDDRYDIGVYRGPRFSLRRLIRRDQPPIQATKEMAVESLSEDPNGCDPEEHVEKGGFVPTVPPLGDMKVAPDGDLWVHRWTPQGDSLIDVFDSTGVYLGTLKDQPMPAAFIGDDRVLVERVDAMDAVFLTIYRVVR